MSEHAVVWKWVQYISGTLIAAFAAITGLLWRNQSEIRVTVATVAEKVNNLERTAVTKEDVRSISKEVILPIARRVDDLSTVIDQHVKDEEITKAQQKSTMQELVLKVDEMLKRIK